MTPSDLDSFAEPAEAENLFCLSLPNLPRAWDSTMLGLAKTCWRKFYYIIILGYRPTGFAAHLAFGIAYHKALETFDKDKAKGATYDEAVNNAIRFCLSYGWRDIHGVFHPYDALYTTEPTKTRDTLVRAVVWYLDQFKDDPAEMVILASGEPAVELSFKLNLTMDTPDGSPFILCGHLDRLVTLDDHYYFTDRKTTKSQLGAYYWASFTPNNQMSLYYAASQLILQEPARGGIIDGVQLGVNFARFARHIIQRTPGQQEEWLKDTYHWLDLATKYAAEDYWPMNDTACSDFGGCPFRSICSKDPKVRQGFLEHEGFAKEQWNPLVSR